MTSVRWGLVLATFWIMILLVASGGRDEERANEFLKSANQKKSRRENKFAIATWNYENNITDKNLDRLLDVAGRMVTEAQEEYKETMKFNWHAFTNRTVRRQFSIFSVLRTQALSHEKFRELLKNKYVLENTIGNMKLCEFKNPKKCDICLHPHLEKIMTTSRNPSELQYYWIEWHKAVGRKIKGHILNFIDLMNEAALLNNLRDTRDLWMQPYEMSDIREKIKKIWQQFKPFYQQFHAYVRYKMREFYGEIISEKGPLPVHLLGSVLGTTWEALSEIVVPYPENEIVDMTVQLVNQSYSPLGLFKTADDFFSSMNFSNLPRMFWEKSFFEKPKDGRKVICSSSAWDFSDGVDFRIRHCAQTDKNTFLGAYRSLANVHYIIQYQEQPKIFQTPAIEAVSNAVGGAISLSAETMTHLFKLGVIKKLKSSPTEVINKLAVHALRTLPLIPLAYVLDMWKWEVFSTKIESANYNCMWWQLMNEHLGVEPPVDRTENDFDPIADYKYMTTKEFSNFIALVLQYQFHRTLCLESGGYHPDDQMRPLHECDIYGSTAAGNSLVDIMKLGCSKSWLDILEIFMGSQNLDIAPLQEYFKPLKEWLIEENQRNGVFIGWGASSKTCHYS